MIFDSCYVILATAGLVCIQHHTKHIILGKQSWLTLQTYEIHYRENSSYVLLYMLSICLVIIAKNIDIDDEIWTPPYAKILFERNLFPAGSALMAAACAKVV